MTIFLKLIVIRYFGKSIGNDIRIEITALDNIIQFDIKLKKGASVRPNLQLGTAFFSKKIKRIPIAIRMIERDILFPDKGSIKATLTIDPRKPFPQLFSNTVEVKEFRGFQTKSAAQFEILIKASTTRDAPKRISTVDDPRWTGDFRDDHDDILLSRLIFGEAENQSKEAKIWIGGSVLNRINAHAWPDTIQKVIRQKGQYDPFKEKDKNFKKIIDPLAKADKGRKKSWEESYEAAHGLLSGSISNPTTATHFHGRGVSRSWFLSHIVPKGKFLKKINDTSFYWSPN